MAVIVDSRNKTGTVSDESGASYNARNLVLQKQTNKQTQQ